MGRDSDKKVHIGWTIALVIAPWVAAGLLAWDIWDGKLLD
jgi:hypothetical protein